MWLKVKTLWKLLSLEKELNVNLPQLMRLTALFTNKLDKQEFRNIEIEWLNKDRCQLFINGCKIMEGASASDLLLGISKLLEIPEHKSPLTVIIREP